MLKSPIFSRIILLGLLSILVWGVFITGKELLLYGNIHEEVTVVEAEIMVLEEENALLVAQRDSKEDIRATELEARKRLNVKKPNEEVVIIIPGDEEAVISYVLDGGVGEKEEATVLEEEYDLFAEIRRLWNYILE